MSPSRRPPPPPPRPRRRRRGGRSAFLLLLLALLAGLFSWIFGDRLPIGGIGGAPRPAADVRDEGDDDPVRTVAVRALPAADPGGAAPSPPPGAELEDERDRPPSPAAGAAVVLGRVLLADGTPAADVTIELRPAVGPSSFPAAGSRAAATTVTDREGRFVAALRPPPDGLRALVLRDGAIVAFSEPRDVEPWQRVTLPDLRLEAASSPAVTVVPEAAEPGSPVVILVRGRAAETPLGAAPLALDAEALPVQAAFVEARHLPARAGEELVLDELPSGPIEIWAAAAGHVPARVQPDGGTQRVTLRAVALEPLADEGLPARVALVDDEAIAFQGVAPVVSDVEGTGAGSQRLLAPGFLPIAAAGGAPLEDARPSAGIVVLSDEEAWRDHVLSWRRAGASTPAEIAMQAFIDRMLEDGAPAAPGTRRTLEAGTWVPRATDADGVLIEGPELIVAPGAEVVLELPRGAPRGRILRLRLVDAEDGAPIAGAAVVMGTPSAGPPTPEARVGTSDADGVVTLHGLPEGEIELGIHAADRAAVPLRIDAQATGAPGVAGGDEGADTLRVELPRAGAGAAVVRLLDGAGRPLADQDVVLVDPFGRSREDRSDAAGTVRVAGLAPGPWVVLPRSGAVDVSADSWSWLAGSSGALVLEVPPGGTAEETLSLPTPVDVLVDLFVTPAAGPAPEIHLRHRGTPFGPGLWPSLALGEQAPGRLRIEGLFPGRYGALATRGTLRAAAELEVPAEPDGPLTLIFHFAESEDR